MTMTDDDNTAGVVVLYNASDRLLKGESRDLLAEQGVIGCAESVAGALQLAGYDIALVPFQNDVELALVAYPPAIWTVFNLAEGSEGRLFEEARIAWALDAMGYCFTGANGDAIAHSTHKARAKLLLAGKGLATPPSWLLRHPDEVEAMAADAPFPLIVKPVAEGGSVGVGTDAVVHTVRELRERVAYVVSHYLQAALVEEFVAGREFNISLWGDPPSVLPLAEIDFAAFSDPCSRIVSFEAKWEVDSYEYHHTPVVCPASVEAGLGERIRDTALRAWTAIGCRGYARVDMRVTEEGIPYVMEVNCNPDLSPDAGFSIAALAGGYSYEDMVVHILENARSQYYVDDRVSFRRGRSVHFADNASGRHLHLHRTELR
jgi:D-alanine-D-alanine ligase